MNGEGHLADELEASCDLLLTQRLILQPLIDIDSKADPVRLVGSGFSDIGTTRRLRCELSRKFAPYLGLVYGGNPGHSRARAFDAALTKVSLDRRGIGRGIVAEANFDDPPGTQGAAALDKSFDSVAEPEGPRPPD